MHLENWRLQLTKLRGTRTSRCWERIGPRMVQLIKQPIPAIGAIHVQPIARGGGGRLLAAWMNEINSHMPTNQKYDGTTTPFCTCESSFPSHCSLQHTLHLCCGPLHSFFNFVNAWYIAILQLRTNGVIHTALDLEPIYTYCPSDIGDYVPFFLG